MPVGRGLGKYVRLAKTDARPVGHRVVMADLVFKPPPVFVAEPRRARATGSTTCPPHRMAMSRMGLAWTVGIEVLPTRSMRTVESPKASAIRFFSAEKS